MKGDNREKLNSMLQEKQIKRSIVFGTFGEPGYEEAWEREGICTSVYARDARKVSKPQAPLGVFTREGCGELGTGLR